MTVVMMMLRVHGRMFVFMLMLVIVVLGRGVHGHDGDARDRAHRGHVYVHSS